MACRPSSYTVPSSRPMPIPLPSLNGGSLGEGLHINFSSLVLSSGMYDVQTGTPGNLGYRTIDSAVQSADKYALPSNRSASSRYEIPRGDNNYNSKKPEGLGAVIYQLHPQEQYRRAA